MLLAIQSPPTAHRADRGVAVAAGGPGRWVEAGENLARSSTRPPMVRLLIATSVVAPGASVSWPRAEMITCWSAPTSLPMRLPLMVIAPMSSSARMERVAEELPPVLVSMPAMIEPPMKTLAMRPPLWMEPIGCGWAGAGDAPADEIAADAHGAQVAGARRE